MSIRNEIFTHVREGRLVLVYPISPGEGVKRSLFVVPKIWEKLDGCWEGGGDDRFAELYADLEVFIGGHIIAPSYLWLLSPKKQGVFQIRSTYPYPQLRLFGVFAERDVMVATHLWDRDELGRYGSDEEKKAHSDCVKVWNDLFPSNDFLKGTLNVNEYVSNAAPGKYFK